MPLGPDTFLFSILPANAPASACVPEAFLPWGCWEPCWVPRGLQPTQCCLLPRSGAPLLSHSGVMGSLMGNTDPPHFSLPPSRGRSLPDGRSPQADPKPAGRNGESSLPVWHWGRAVQVGSRKARAQHPSRASWLQGPTCPDQTAPLSHGVPVPGWGPPAPPHGVLPTRAELTRPRSPLQLKSFHNELLTQLEQKVELDSRYLSVSSPATPARCSGDCSSPPPLRGSVSSERPPRAPLAPAFLPFLPV